jgi:hypothetical protein
MCVRRCSPLHTQVCHVKDRKPVAIQDIKSANPYLIEPEHFGAIPVNSSPSDKRNRPHLLAHFCRMFVTGESCGSPKFKVVGFVTWDRKESCVSPKFQPFVKSTACKISSPRLPAITLVHVRLFLALVRSASSCLSFRRSLLVENLALRQQLIVLKRKHPRPKLRALDKLFWVLARRCWSAWKQSLIVVCRFSRKWRAALSVSELFRPSGEDFKGVRVDRSDEVGAGRRAVLARPGFHRLDEPTRLSLGMVASQQSPLPFHLARSL